MNTHLFFGLLIWGIGIAGILMLTIFPIIFWLFIIPGIQKRAGKKFLYDKFFGIYPIFKYMGYTEVAFAISIKYIGFKFFGDQKRFKLKRERLLETISYDVSEASKFEIFFSFLCVLSCAVFVIGLITGGIFDRG